MKLNVKKILLCTCVIVVSLLAFCCSASADSYVSKPIYASVNASNSYYQQLRSIAQFDFPNSISLKYCFYRDSQYSYRLDILTPSMLNPSDNEDVMYGNVMSYIYHTPRDSQPYWDIEYHEFDSEWDDYYINNIYGYTYVANFYPLATGADVPPIEDTSMTAWFYQNKMYMLVASILMILLFFVFVPKINPITKSQKGVNL